MLSSLTRGLRRLALLVAGVACFGAAFAIHLCAEEPKKEEPKKDEPKKTEPGQPPRNVRPGVDPQQRLEELRKRMEESRKRMEERRAQLLARRPGRFGRGVDDSRLGARLETPSSV